LEQFLVGHFAEPGADGFHVERIYLDALCAYVVGQGTPGVGV
jgi:hypothetical protein